MKIKNYCKLLRGFKLSHSSAIITRLIVLFALLSNKAHLAVEEWMPHSAYTADILDQDLVIYDKACNAVRQATTACWKD